MHTVLLSFHVVGMSLSLLLLLVAVGLKAVKHQSARRFVSAGAIATALGYVSGMVLLLSAPVASKCLMLTAYVVLFGLVYRYGFFSSRPTSSVPK